MKIISMPARLRLAIGFTVVCCAFVAACALGYAKPVSAQAPSSSDQAAGYPAHPVHLIVPYTAGGPADVLARLIAQKLGSKWGQPIVVDNRPGANTVIGMELVARSAPDGYTLVLATTAMAINPAMMQTVPFDAVKDFTPIIDLVSGSFVLVVNPSLPARSLQELIALAKEKPGTLSFGSGGTGSPTHVSGELLKNMAGIEMVHVPYKGIAPALTDLLAGHIQLLFGDPLVVLPHVKEGKLRAIAVSGATRYSAAPEIATLAEAGLPGYESTLWYGLLGPAGMPRPVVAKLNAEIAQIFNEPDVQQRLAGMGTSVIADSPEHFATFIRAELQKWGKASLTSPAAGREAPR